MQKNSIMVLLNSFANESRLGKNENVMGYWEQFRESKRELYELSQVALAIPATQGSVKSFFRLEIRFLATTNEHVGTTSGGYTPDT